MGVSRARGGMLAVTVVLSILVAALLAACASGGNVQITPVASPAGTAPATLALAPTPSPTTSLVSTPGAQQGEAEFCAQPPSVSAQLPPSIPAYPGAELRIGQASGGFGLFGLCTQDGVSAVAAYYASQLPSHGWQQVQSTSISSVRQVSANRAGAAVSITIQPDAQLAATTDIIVQTTGL